MKRTKSSNFFNRLLQKSRQNKLVTFFSVFLVLTLIIAGSLGGYFATRETSTDSLQTIAPDDFITKKHLDEELAKKLSLSDVNDKVKDAHSSLKSDASFQTHLSDALTTKFADYLQKSAFSAELKASVKSLKTDAAFKADLADALTTEFDKYYSKTATDALLNTYLKKADLPAETKTAIEQLKTDAKFKTDIKETLQDEFDKYYTKTVLDPKLTEARTVVKQLISNLTDFSDLTKIAINSPVYFSFAGNYTPSEFATNLFFGTLLTRHNGEDIYVGFINDYNNNKIKGFYRLKVRDNGSGKAAFTFEKVTLDELKDYYNKTAVDAELAKKSTLIKLALTNTDQPFSLITTQNPQLGQRIWITWSSDYTKATGGAVAEQTKIQNSQFWGVVRGSTATTLTADGFSSKNGNTWPTQIVLQSQNSNINNQLLTATFGIKDYFTQTETNTELAKKSTLIKLDLSNTNQSFTLLSNQNPVSGQRIYVKWTNDYAKTISGANSQQSQIQDSQFWGIVRSYDGTRTLYADGFSTKNGNTWPTQIMLKAHNSDINNQLLTELFTVKNFYTQQQITALLGFKADTSTIATFNTELNKKADKTDLFEPASVTQELKLSLTPKLATKSELNAKADKLTEVDLATKTLNGKLFSAWTSLERTAYDALFTPGEVYKILYGGKTYIVRAATESISSTEAVTNFYGMIIGTSINPYGFIGLEIKISTSSSFTVKNISLEKLAFVIDNNAFLYNSSTKTYKTGNTFFKKYPRIIQSAPLFTGFQRQFTTHATLLATWGIFYQLTDSTPDANGNSAMKIFGAKAAWFDDITRPKWTENKFTPNAYLGRDYNSDTNFGEGQYFSGYRKKKRFYKGDTIFFKIHGHVNVNNKWAGIKFLLKNNSGVELKTTGGVFSNDFLANNETYKYTGASSTNKAHLMVNLFANKYFHFEGKIVFEDAAIFIDAQGWINQLGNDLNKIAVDAALDYPTGYTDGDGIILDAIDIFEVNKSNFEKTSDAVKWRAGTKINLRDHIGNKNLGITQITTYT